MQEHMGSKSTWGQALPFACRRQLAYASMARPFRIEFPGAGYHNTSRGDRREPIFADDEDRCALLGVVAQATVIGIPRESADRQSRTGKRQGLTLTNSDKLLTHEESTMRRAHGKSTCKSTWVE